MSYANSLIQTYRYPSLDGVRYSDTDDLAKVLRRGYFTILRDDWKPKNEPMFGPIPDEILKAV